jgi:hypothetical protein
MKLQDLHLLAVLLGKTLGKKGSAEVKRKRTRELVVVDLEAQLGRDDLEEQRRAALGA